ncbi:uncharacterized protein plekhg6 isoform X2 [Megalops cyprinoides]|uniref:uncharacterized protein plekhg6 isoform X2 n=1 Tax=Megalops cyprinoides TaxID=118141 RepID=UPI0018655993|nr:uncharacterized protein plekhg6 isoform X2 [Megalops cyprinoides]
MDPGKPSPSSKSSALNVRGSDATQPEEVSPSIWASGQGDPGRDDEVERPWMVERDMESAVDGITALLNHRGAAEKQRFNTLGYQKQKQGLGSDFATLSKGVSGSVKPRGALRQVLFSQGVSDKSPSPEERSQLEALKQTLESFPTPSLPEWKGGGDANGVTLERSWTDIVHSHSTMSKTQRHQQEALWELIHTELSYINKLTIVTDLVIAALINLHQKGFLSEVKPQLLFSNLPSILHAHRLFWEEVMWPMIQEVRLTGKPFDPLKLEAGCLQFNERFFPYLQYCWEEEKIVDFTRRQIISNPQFHTYLTWVESHPQVDRMRLGDMQAKPHQRITKYPLLLKAILKTTEDALTQYSVRRMLASVNSFLDSINDYLRVKDDELALSLSAQRIEGYEVIEGISEEVDKHIREFCRFDLTSPIQGVGPHEIRKLLLEETLKIRERKDNKLEAVLLLFSDVLLLTKAQRKSEKLKVIRPPLALDRIRCSALRDGCSFVLAEMSDLGCAVSVYMVTTPSQDSCALWVTTIRSAQESLATMRQRETAHKLGEFRQADMLIERQTPPLLEAKGEGEEEEKEEPGNFSEVEEAPLSDERPKEETTDRLSENGALPLAETEGENNTQNQLKNMNFLLLGRYNPCSQSARGNFASRCRDVKNIQREVKGVVMSKEEESESNQAEYAEIVLSGIKERRVTWNHSRSKHLFSNPDTHATSQRNSTESQSNALQSSFLEKVQNAETSLVQSAPRPSSLPGEEFNVDTEIYKSESKESLQRGKFTRRDSEGQLSDQGSRRDSCHSQSGEEFLTDTWRFSRKLNSPRLRRRRPITGQQSPPPQMVRKGSLDSGQAMFTLNRNSSSNSDSDSHQILQGVAHLSAQTPHSPSTLNQGSLRVNRGVFWIGPLQRVSPDPRTFSEPELSMSAPRQSSQKKARLKTQRSASIPDIVVPDLLTTPGWSSAASIPQSSQPQGGPQPRTSSLEDILERARGRGRGQEGEKAKAGRRPTRNLLALDCLPFSSLSTPPSPSEGERETKPEDSELPRVHAPTEDGDEVRQEEGSDEERKLSFPLPDGASVDWLGWCVDDDEVMVRLVPEGSGGEGGAGEGGSRTLTLRDFRRISIQEDGECSEV